MPNAGDVIYASDFPAVANDTQSTSGTTTDTSFTPTLTGGTACGVAFIAPPTGKVLIVNTCQMTNSGANNTRCSFYIREGSSVGTGAAFLASADGRSNLHNGTTDHGSSRVHPVTGLTPGASYNVQQEFRVTAGTGTFSQKNLIVMPTT